MRSRAVTYAVPGWRDQRKIVRAMLNGGASRKHGAAGLDL